LGGNEILVHTNLELLRKGGRESGQYQQQRVDSKWWAWSTENHRGPVQAECVQSCWPAELKTDHQDMAIQKGGSAVRRSSNLASSFFFFCFFTKTSYIWVYHGWEKKWDVEDEGDSPLIFVPIKLTVSRLIDRHNLKSS
jgi:hypothetical protein